MRPTVTEPIHLAMAALFQQPELVVYPLRVEPAESGRSLILDANDREIADLTSAYDAGVLVDAYNTAHKAVA